MCLVGSEEAQSEPHQQGTIDDILEDQDIDEFPDADETADEEGELLEQVRHARYPVTERGTIDLLAPTTS